MYNDQESDGAYISEEVEDEFSESIEEEKHMELSATDFSRDLSAQLTSSAQPMKSIVIDNRSPSIIK